MNVTALHLKRWWKQYWFCIFVRVGEWEHISTTRKGTVVNAVFTATLKIYCIWRPCPILEKRSYKIECLFKTYSLKLNFILHIWLPRKYIYGSRFFCHYGDLIMGAIASQITSLTIVYSTVYSDTDHRHHGVFRLRFRSILSIRIIWLKYDCPSANDETLKDMVPWVKNWWWRILYKQSRTKPIW